MLNEANRRLLTQLAAIVALPAFLIVGLVGSLVVLVWGDLVDYEEMQEMWGDLFRLVLTGKMKWED